MITIISGTNRPGSNTRKVASHYREQLSDKGIDAQLVSLECMNVHERSGEIECLEKTLLIPSDKFIFIVPEYNGSIPGVLKSLIDITDIRKVWQGKKALLTGVSTGRAGNLRGMEHLTGILNYVKMTVHPNKLPISIVDKLLDQAGSITDRPTLFDIDNQIAEFILF
jgi:chromate reductase, NAD(P)H dehydrogenase (quinone)